MSSPIHCSKEINSAQRALKEKSRRSNGVESNIIVLAGPVWLQKSPNASFSHTNMIVKAIKTVVNKGSICSMLTVCKQKVSRWVEGKNSPIR